MIKEAISGLIQEIWAGSKTEHSNLGPKEDEGVINLIHADVNPVKNNETQQRKGTQDRSMDRFEGMTSTRCL
jgi:hypothetical protein